MRLARNLAYPRDHLRRGEADHHLRVESRLHDIVLHGLDLAFTKSGALPVQHTELLEPFVQVREHPETPGLHPLKDVHRNRLDGLGTSGVVVVSC